MTTWSLISSSFFFPSFFQFLIELNSLNALSFLFGTWNYFLLILSEDSDRLQVGVCHNQRFFLSIYHSQRSSYLNECQVSCSRSYKMFINGNATVDKNVEISSCSCKGGWTCTPLVLQHCAYSQKFSHGFMFSICKSN